jgi:hypothetical protein
MSEYPEHDKLHTVVDESQAQGAFIEWLSDQGIKLMVWREWDETTTEECSFCLHGSPASEARCQCPKCEGAHVREVTRHYESWMSVDRSIQTLLAEYHGIDQRKLEQEKRAMLASLRAAS